MNANLNPREIEALNLFAAGEAPKMIADKMRVSLKTVGKYKELLSQKLCTSGTIALVRVAIRNGFVTTEEFLQSRVGEHLN